MKFFTGSVMIALATAGVAAAIGIGSAGSALAANQALMLNGIGTSGLPDLVMSNVLGGMFGTYERTNVSWPMQARPVTGANSLTLTESVKQGATNLDAAIHTALTKIGPGEHVTVVGLSAGSLVADEELRRLLTDTSAPEKSKLNFVVVGDSSRIPFNKNRLDATINYQYRVPAQTKYDTMAVAAEYDGFADFPDRPWNALAVANAIAGEIVTHVPSMFTNLSRLSAQNITATTNPLGGVTTRYFVPAAHLPLVQLVPGLASQEASLRKIVDSGYARNDAKPAGTSPASVAKPVATTKPAQTISAPAVSPVHAAVEVPQSVAEPASVNDGPAATPPTGRSSVADSGSRSVGHRGSAAHGSDRSGARSQTAHPAAAARSGSRHSA